jgi:adenylate cyclase, class 1
MSIEIECQVAGMAINVRLAKLSAFYPCMTCMRIETFKQNKRSYLSYNNFRKQIFSEISPEDSEIILFMLPWMLSINDEAVPGYVPELEAPVAVYGIGARKKILKREATFKKLLNINRRSSLLSLPVEALQIQGIYTIGSIGTISQTAHSDCDIWICLDKTEFTAHQFQQLNQKINLVKDWLDTNCRIPVYFFICDVTDIRNANFGGVDHESSGTTQKNTLKEEFYRTAITIAGKIPLWWLCFDKDQKIDYDDFRAHYVRVVSATAIASIWDASTR